MAKDKAMDMASMISSKKGKLSKEGTRQMAIAAAFAIKGKGKGAK